ARRQLAALLFPLCLTLFAFAEPILGFWLGRDYGRSAGTALQILTVGVFFGGLAHLPLALLYGANRPDIPARIHIVQAAVYIPVTFVLVKAFGINGAALAWMGRNASDLIVYEIASARAFGRPAIDHDERARTSRLSLTVVGLSIAFLFSVWLIGISWQLGIAVALVALAMYGFAGWTRVLSQTERNAWRGILSRARPTHHVAV
ncbi:MAG TPA: polysaccharide biosynthesis C-terminal domain-containing protein, partial [Gemmatimonadaceae bacterium]|nr:polysaccharide biosynthesis C-terminal domain-containing protein [Gemmatimonadaceae bacterium]